MICCPSSFSGRSGGREAERGFREEEIREEERKVGVEGKRGFGGEVERRVGGEGRREREELTTPSTPVFGRGGFAGGEEEEPRGGGEEDYGDEFPVFSGTFFPVSDEFP